MRQIRLLVNNVWIESLEQDEIPDAPATLLEDLLTDLEVNNAHKIAILDFVNYELAFLFFGNNDEDD